MGNSSGVSQGVGKALVPQRTFERTIHERFITDTVVTLEFLDQFWSQPRNHAIEIKDVARDKVLFTVPPVSMDADDQPKRKLLLDADGEPVAGVEEHEIPSVAAQLKAFAVIAGGLDETRELFRFETDCSAMHKQSLVLALDGNSYETPSRIRVIGRWLTRQSAVGIQRQGGDLYMIARVYPVGSVLDGVYRMDVAPGVDLALMVLFAGVLDPQHHRFERTIDRLRLKDRAKQQEKEEKKLLKQQAKAEKKALKAQQRPMRRTITT